MWDLIVQNVIFHLVLSFVLFEEAEGSLLTIGVELGVWLFKLVLVVGIEVPLPLVLPACCRIHWCPWFLSRSHETTANMGQIEGFVTV